MCFMILFFFTELIFSYSNSDISQHEIDSSDVLFDKPYPNIGRVGFYAEYLGTVQRKIPEVKSENLIPIDRIPKFDTNLGHTEIEKQALLNESRCITTSETVNGKGIYNAMDQDGNLYFNSNLLHYDNGTVRRLYKHIGAIGNYRGDVSNDEPAIIKRMNILPHGFGYSITGLYAPAGEVITVRISEKDLKSCETLKFSFGQILNNDKSNNIWLAREFSRMPVLSNTFHLTPNLFPHKRCKGDQCETANSIDDYYQMVGSEKVSNTNYLKNVDYTGADYIFYTASFLGGPIYLKSSTMTPFWITISGAVRYAHFIKGYTTREEFAANWASSAPYIDLEIWQGGILHSGPRMRADVSTFDEFQEAAVYWEKVTAVSHQVPSGTDYRCVINMMYECFIAAGGAVAFPSQGSTNCPDYWLTYVLNYRKNLIDSTGDVWGPHHEYHHHFQRAWGFTGDGEVNNNAVTLVSYSLFTKTSQRRTETSEPDGDGWNRYTSASFAVSSAIGNHDNNLVAHAVLLHCFGQYLFIDAASLEKGRNNDANYEAFTEVTGLDFSYFFNDVYKTLTISDEIIAKYNNSQYKKFVPIASRYQTGVGYMIKGKRNEIHTMRPFRIEYSKDKVLNFTEKMVVPQDIQFTIKSVSQPEHGSIEKSSENIYIYHPDKDHVFSGKITMTIGLRNTKYTDFLVDDVEMYFEFMQSHQLRNKFKNERVLDKTIYVYNEGELPTDPVAAFESNYAGHIDSVDIENNNTLQNSNSELWYYPQEYFPNRISELRGKTKVTPGKYRFALRGRLYVALFISLDEGKNYQLAGKSSTYTDANFHLTDSNTYHDYEFTKEQWVYFKAVLVQQATNNNRPYIGVGMGKFDAQGNVNVQYLSNAFEQSYQDTPEPEFISENPFPRVWTEKFSLTLGKGTLVKYSYIPWTAGVEAGLYDIENLFDDNDDNIIHTAKEFPVSESNPFSVTVDLGSLIDADTMTIYGAFEKNYQYQPKDFKLYLGNDLNDLQSVANVSGATVTNKNVIVKFKQRQFRYYQLNVTDTYAANRQYRYVSYRYIAFSSSFAGTAVSLDDDRVTLYNSWKKEAKLCTFGNLYIGECNSKISFRFTGTKIGIKAYSSPEYGTFWVYIDGVRVKFIDLNTDYNQICCVYKKIDLEDKDHVLTIRGFTKFNIDSFVVGEELSNYDESLDDVAHNWEGIEPTATPLPTPVIIPPSSTPTQSATPLPPQSPTPAQTQTPTPYPLLPVDESVLTNPSGLVNITCDKFQYTGWDEGGRGQICVQSDEANHGSFTRNTGAKAKVNFIGSKFHILAWKQENSGPANIWVDGVLIGTPNFNSNNGGRNPGIAFTSPDLSYSEHTLEIEHVGEFNTQSVVLGSIYVDPLPSVGSFNYTYKDFKVTSGTWTESTSTTPSTFTCNDGDCSGEFEFFGTRFWLTGVRSSDKGEFEITIDDGTPILIQERQTSEIAQNNLPVLLYQSNELSFKLHKVKITRTSYPISLVNLLFTLYPHSEIPTQSPAPTQSPYPLLPVDESVMGNQEGLVNITCDKFEYTGWDEGGRGQICVRSNEADHGSFTRNTGAIARVKFIGTKFHILAWKQENSGLADIRVDGKSIGNPNFNSGNQLRFAGIAFTSPEFPYGEHTLEIEHIGEFNINSVILGSIYVNPLPDVGGYKLAYEDFKVTHGAWSKSTSTTPATFSCTDDDCSGEFEFYGTRFWLTGHRGNDKGEFEITIDDGTPILIQERQESSIAQNNMPVILYQSNELEFRPHKVKITRTGYPISLNNLLYTIYPHTEMPTPYPTQTPTPIPLLPVDESVLTNPTGLVNITCDKFQYTGWDEGGRGQICVQSGEANHGSFTRNTGAKAKVNFIGSKFHILAWKQENSGPAKIWVDGVLIGTPNFNSNGGRYSGIVFTSPEFPYGEHTLEIEHVGEFNTQSVVLGSIYVDPVPSVGGHKLAYQDFKATSGTWTESTSTTPSTFTCNDGDCSGEFEFFGTRFWLTGVRSSDKGEFEITIDDGTPILIQERQTSEIAQNNLPVLLYQSNELSFKLHKVKITRTNYPISLVNLIYTLHPHTEVPTQSPYPLLPVDESVLTNQNGLLNITCDKFQYTGWDEGGRGQICVQSNEANHGSFTRNTGAKAKVNFIGSKFHILAWKQENSGPANIWVDGVLIGTPNFNSNNGGRYSGIAFTSPEFPYGEHTLEIEHVGQFNTNSVVLGSIYVDPLPEVGGYKLSYEDFIVDQGTWTKDTSKTAPVFTCSGDSCIGEFEFIGTKFWLTGVRGTDTGDFEIIIDDNGQPIHVDERQTSNIAQNNLPVVLYQSQELPLAAHKVRIQRTSYPISLVNLLYTIYPYTEIPNPTPQPTEEIPSEIIVEDENLNQSRFDKVIEVEQVVTVSIKVSNFTNVSYKENGGAIHVVNAGFQCEKVDFEKCTSEEAGGAIYLSNSLNLENSLVLDGLTFNGCEAKFGGAVYIYSSSKNNPAIVRNCIFTNNDAYLTKENSQDGKYGGSAIFMTARNGAIEGNTIRDNKGDTAVKIYNHFNKAQNNKARKLDKDYFLISNCQFEISKDESSCLYYMLGNEASSFVLRDCTFKGKLSEKAHYIDGSAINKHGPKLVVKKCRFAALDSNKAFNLDSINEFMSIDLKDQVFNDSDKFGKESFGKWKIIVAVVVPAVAVALIVVIAVVIAKRKNNNVVEECEMSAQTFVIPENDDKQNNQLNLPLL